MYFFFNSPTRNNRQPQNVVLKLDSVDAAKHLNDAADEGLRVAEGEELAVDEEEVGFGEAAGGTFLDESAVKLVDFLFIDCVLAEHCRRKRTVQEKEKEKDNFA